MATSKTAQVKSPIPKRPIFETLHTDISITCLVVLGFNATLTAKVGDKHVFPGSHQYITFFPKPPTIFLTCLIGERPKHAGKKGHLNTVWNSQSPGHKSDMLTTETFGRNRKRVYLNQLLL